MIHLNNTGTRVTNELLPQSFAIALNGFNGIYARTIQFTNLKKIVRMTTQEDISMI